jgi:hypothetical protein
VTDVDRYLVLVEGGPPANARRHEVRSAAGAADECGNEDARVDDDPDHAAPRS